MTRDRAIQVMAQAMIAATNQGPGSEAVCYRLAAIAYDALSQAQALTRPAIQAPPYVASYSSPGEHVQGADQSAPSPAEPVLTRVFG